MQIKVSVTPEGDTFVEVVDPSDRAVTHTVPLSVEQQVVISTPTAATPADIEVGEVEAFSAAPAEVEGEAPEPADPEGDAAKIAEQPDPPVEDEAGTTDPDPATEDDGAAEGEPEPEGEGYAEPGDEDRS